MRRCTPSGSYKKVIIVFCYAKRNNLALAPNMTSLLRIFLFVLIGVFVVVSSKGQKTSVGVQLKDSSNPDTRNWQFSVSIKNKKLRRYLVQDTSFMRGRLGNPYRNSITPFLAKLTGNEYVRIDDIVRGLHTDIPVFDTCFWQCCNCIKLKRGKELSFIIPLLLPIKLDKGQYRLQVVLTSPIWGCRNCRHHQDIASDYIYFTVQ